MADEEKDYETDDHKRRPLEGHENAKVRVMLEKYDHHQWAWATLRKFGLYTGAMTTIWLFFKDQISWALGIIFTSKSGG